MWKKTSRPAPRPPAAARTADMRAVAGLFSARRRWFVALVCVVAVATTALRAENPPSGGAALSASAVESWLAAFADDYASQGPEALWSRLDQARLAERVAALDSLGATEAGRRADLIRQRVGNDRASYAGFNQLTVGRRTDAGDHWAVLTHYNSDAGLFFYRRLRLEADATGAARLAGWADMPCDLEMAEDIATLALLQLREAGEHGSLPEARRAELRYYRDNPQKLMQLYFAMRATTARQILFRAVFAELPPVAKYGVIARDARTQWFVSLEPAQIADELPLLIGQADEDPLRGLLMFRAGLRGEKPALALAGMDILSAQIGEDAMWRSERGTLLDRAGRLDEAVEFTRESAELYPAFYLPHVHHLAALRRAGRADEAERRSEQLVELFGADVAKVIAKNAADFARDQEERAARARETADRVAPPASPAPARQARMMPLTRAPIDPAVFEAPAIQVTLPFDAGGHTDHSLNRDDYR